MKALDHKLFRDLWRLRGQVLAVGMVIASGVATLVMSVSTLQALQQTTHAYYERYRFGDMFAHVTRAPETLVPRIAQLSGVQVVETRVIHFAQIDVPDFVEPIIGQLTAIPEHKQPDLNQLVLRRGRWVSKDDVDEVIISEPFAEAHALVPGDTLSAIINGKKRRLSIVGVALSPEFIYALGPGALLPDDKRFGIFWMGREALAAAFDLDHAFNHISLSLLRGAESAPVMARLDAMLERYGGISAVNRDNQLSNWFVMNEIEQLKTMSTILPTIFLSVAAFLTHTVLSRMIITEREEIGLLKAFGYSGMAIGWHYTKFILALCLVGISVGWVLGGILGRYNTEIYAELFRFPLLIYQPSLAAFVLASGGSIASALLGGLWAVRKAVRLPPAQAMIPPAPAQYHRGVLADSRLSRWLDQPTRIALRQISRWPLRSLFTAIGVAFSVGLLVMSLQWHDAIDHIAETYFFSAQRQDATIGLTEEEAARVIYAIKRIPGVQHAEPMRIVNADLRVANRVHRGAINAIEPDSYLQPIYDDHSRKVLTVPPSGLVLASRLAHKLGVQVGDKVWVDILEGRRPSGYIPVVATFDTYIGMPAVMDLAALNRWLQEHPRLQFANLLIDEKYEAQLFSYLKTLPTVSAVMLRQTAYQSFYDTVGENLLFFTSVFTSLAAALAFGVAYNSTRIALSERGRELATLRVLGFTRGEISYILLGEVGLLVLLGLPVGCISGWLLVWIMTSSFDTELFRIPLVIKASTYGVAVIIALVSAAVSAVLVRRRVDQLDLIQVLKTRE